jgi:hypothetical protein
VSNPPWNDWYHVVSHVYGSWLRGDPSGWRSKNYREHVEGDYRNPPAKGKYEIIFERSRGLMKRDPVSVQTGLRGFVVEAVVEKLQRDEIEVLVASVDAKHLHVLGRFRDHEPRNWLGIAKKHASHLLRQEGLRTEQGGLWAKRSRAQPVRDRAHQLSVFGYILRHGEKGAAVWRFDRARKS